MYINVELSMLIKYSLLFFSSYLCMYVPLIVISYIEDTCKNVYTFSFNTILFLLNICISDQCCSIVQYVVFEETAHIFHDEKYCIDDFLDNH